MKRNKRTGPCFTCIGKISVARKDIHLSTHISKMQNSMSISFTIHKAQFNNNRLEKCLKKQTDENDEGKLLELHQSL